MARLQVIPPSEWPDWLTRRFRQGVDWSGGPYVVWIGERGAIFKHGGGKYWSSMLNPSQYATVQYSWMSRYQVREDSLGSEFHEGRIPGDATAFIEAKAKELTAWDVNRVQVMEEVAQERVRIEQRRADPKQCAWVMHTRHYTAQCTELGVLRKPYNGYGLRSTALHWFCAYHDPDLERDELPEIDGTFDSAKRAEQARGEASSAAREARKPLLRASLDMQSMYNHVLPVPEHIRRLQGEEHQCEWCGNCIESVVERFDIVLMNIRITRSRSRKALLHMIAAEDAYDDASGRNRRSNHIRYTELEEDDENDPNL